MQLCFSDVFQVSEETLDQFGAFNISVVNDLPLFIDPFLLFNSVKPEYQKLHESIISYLSFLRDLSQQTEQIPEGLISALFRFGEVKENWLGYSASGNSGRGLGPDFARALAHGLKHFFSGFGKEAISKGSHLEKLCLFDDGVGRDSISDFTTNLIKQYLLQYTQEFAKAHISQDLRAQFNVKKVSFNYTTSTWQPESFDLPRLGNNYVMLTPKDLLTKDRTWIDRLDFESRCLTIVESVSDNELRATINKYLNARLKAGLTKDEKRGVFSDLIATWPAILDYYIRYKEDTGGEASHFSSMKVEETYGLFVRQVRKLVLDHLVPYGFYSGSGDSVSDVRHRLKVLRNALKGDDARRLFHSGNKPIKSMKELELFFRLLWHANPSSQSSATRLHPPEKVPVQLFFATSKMLFNALSPWRSAALPASTERLAICCTQPSDREFAQHAIEGLLPSARDDVFIIDLCEPSASRFESEYRVDSSEPKRIPTKRFQVAFSFSGSHRSFIEEIADLVSRILTRDHVFYDKYHEAELARPDLDIYIQDIYHKASGLVVIFISKEYQEKDWCYLESRVIRDLIKSGKSDEIMFIRMDDAECDGVFGIDGFVDARGRPAIDIATLILQRHEQLASKTELQG